MKIITESKIIIDRKEEKLDNIQDIQFLIEYLENNKGMFLSSGTEYPGRYSRWETGFIAPPIEVKGFYNRVEFIALNKKGVELLKMFLLILEKNKNDYTLLASKEKITASINFSSQFFCEEERSKQPSILTPIKDILLGLKNDTKDPLGFYGAFGFDLLFQFEKIKLKNLRDDKKSIIRLFFPDKIYCFDRKKEEIFLYQYNFEFDNYSTFEIPSIEPLKPTKLEEIRIEGEIKSTLSDNQYSALVEAAKEHMKRGDIFELVLRRRYYASYKGSPSKLFSRMIEINPSPYQFFCQFQDEQLIGTSPEMFVRVTNDKVETCPISGTIKRGKNPLEDEIQIKKLLNSKKDETELTMCTDVDRNDKSRVCIPGSIKLLGRRQIEKYKGLFHTVDHVIGTLRADCSAIDAFLSHMWAVTLMGSPKKSAAELIEQYENEPRDYYGGAVGVLFCNGNLNTGITIRTIHLKDSIANYSAGASLVYDSNPIDEAIETKIKATSFFNIFSPKDKVEIINENPAAGLGVEVVVIDNEDSFVNTLSDYFRQTGALVSTYRSGVSIDAILSKKPNLVVHSPGPKLPSDFNMEEYILALDKHNIPQFGVCLGLQGIVETYKGTLRRIETPRQGKTWTIEHNSKNIFKGLDNHQEVGAYHSWAANEAYFPKELEISAKSENGLIMGINHKTKPIWAVQFHPESIMSASNNFGLKLIENVIKLSKESFNK